VVSSILLVLISGFVFSVDYIFDNVFKQHHETDLTSYWGNLYEWIRYTNQSEIAIGSGGWLGKDSSRAHKPKEALFQNSTDYIFTTVGEEWGFAGSLVVMALFAGLLLRIIYLAERQNKIQ
jgi:rod shape determining protein RodA